MVAKNVDAQTMQHCTTQFNHPKLPILPVIAAAMERKREQEVANTRRVKALGGKLNVNESYAERQHRSIVVDAEQQLVDVVCEDEQRIRGHIYKVKATN